MLSKHYNVDKGGLYESEDLVGVLAVCQFCGSKVLCNSKEELYRLGWEIEGKLKCPECLKG